ncbi:MAG: hypothetical protein CSB47_01605 [Proteobacteria bacterium]|nr:MAG: hypothetical protein CSB47_01605 [Pseudomonadota bacterium]
MSHVTKEEYLSAFLDGEAGSFEQQRLCDQLECDELMREKLADFALIGEAVRNRSQSRQTVAGSSFLSGIQDAIAEDETPQVVAVDDSAIVISGKVAKRRIFPKHAVGYAAVASVAAVAAISLQNYFLSGEQAETLASTAAPAVNQPVHVDSAAKMTAALDSTAAPRPVALANSPQPMSVHYQQPDAKTRDMIDKYVAHHLQYAGSNTLMPSVRAVSYSMEF